MLHDKGNDIHINVPSVEVEKLIPRGKKIKKPESSEKIGARVRAARQIQNKRFKGTGVHVNANMKNKHIKEHIRIEKSALNLLKQAVNSYNLSARTYFRLLKVSQTIADLAGDKKVGEHHVAESLQYRIRVES